MICGALKFGAWNDCDACGSAIPDADLSIAFSDHRLTEGELKILGQAVKTIQGLGLDDETRLMAFLYYVGRRWPKLLEFSPETLPEEQAHLLDGIYRSHLAHLPAQSSPDTLISPVTKAHWGRASSQAFQEAEDSWLATLPVVLVDGLRRAQAIIRLRIQAGDGATLQRARFRLRSLLSPPDFRHMVAEAEILVHDVSEYGRTVSRFRKSVKNGWSPQTRLIAEYLGGTHFRLNQMARGLLRLLRHKAAIDRMVPLEVERVRQELTLSYDAYLGLVRGLNDPRRIPPVDRPED